MPSLAELVDVVIGVDTHKHTHTAAVVDATTGGLLAEVTIGTDPAGYAQLLELADLHGSARAWALEGAGGYGAGLARHLTGAGEQVIELDRPARAARRHGAKSDSLDAARAAREALGRAHLAQVKTDGPRAQLAALMAARRSAVEAATLAQRQLHALVTAAPEALRALFRGRSTTTMTSSAARLRLRPAWDAHTTTTASVLRTLARRVLALQAEARDHERAITVIVTDWRPDLLAQPGIGAIVAAQVLVSWTDPLRGRIRDAHRHRTHPRLVRTAHPSPTQPIRGPPAQPRPARRGAVPNPLPPAHPRLHRTPPRPGQDRPRDPPLPQALHRPRPVPPTRTRPAPGLTNHRSVARPPG